MRPAALPATLSGRTGERTRLLDGVRAGLQGAPRAVLVHGEVGIGKTTLVRSVCEQVRGERAQVLWGRSLRFGAVEAMYHPLVLALEGWLREADDAKRAAVIQTVPGAALILPSLGASPSQGHSMLMMVVDALIGRVVAQGPTVLVVDDVQWADPATWDALSYVVAGFGHQRLTLVMTHRDEAAVSDEFQHWLANVRRLPGVEELLLSRLDEEATTDQITALLGRPPQPRLVEQVYERSRGNPYFSELLVRRGDLDSDELPADLPDELSQALLDAWRGMSGQTRELSRILAVCGRPADLRALEGVARELGVTGTGLVREAVDAGVVVIGSEDVWFRHPLLAAVLAESYLSGEAAPVHAAWAARLESVSAEGVDELRRLGDLASHYERAGDALAAFRALLQGADLAEKLHGHREAADLLVRAVDLWGVAGDTSDTVAHARLLERAGIACRRVGRAQEVSRLLRGARDLVSVDRDPLWASRLTRWIAGTADGLGGESDVINDEQRAVELSSVDPDSGEHAEALAQLSDSLWWDGRIEEANQLVERAVAAAHRSGSPSAISWAHGMRAMQRMDTDLEQAARDCQVSWDHALASRLPEVISSAYADTWNLLSARGDQRRLLEHARDAYRWSAAEGMMVFQANLLANALLASGNLREAEVVVRAGLAGGGNTIREAHIRLAAATLAVRRGANDAACDHLLRARELRSDLEQRPGLMAGQPIAEVLLATHDQVGAFELIERVLPVNAVDPRVVDDLMVWGARAAADLVERASDNRDPAAVQVHRGALARLVEMRATLPGTAFRPSCPTDNTQLAQAALFAAESGRAEGARDQIDLWRAAVSACAAAGLGWDEQLSTWRLAVTLIESHAPGIEAAALLRGVHDYAVQQNATPLRTRVEDLAASARISLTNPPRTPLAATVPAAFTGLTARENEVLAHLVANRTNAEIAASLFISKKTVSVHVTNLLRKTDTGSRREVAALARRVGWVASDGGPGSEGPDASASTLK